MAPDLSSMTSRHELDRPSPRAARSHSISSDRPSMNGSHHPPSPSDNISPPPAFIASSAASQIITNDHDSQYEIWLDQNGLQPPNGPASVTPVALKLVNRFLDQLLFSFLTKAQSTSLVALRPAISEVLKPKLAKDAITGAEQELLEYLGGTDESELLDADEPGHNGEWDLELVWKRTRLRCMVYSSLGDMEEEDEDYYTEQEHLYGNTAMGDPYSENAGVVSPAVAIFLTSILEFMGEQALVIAGRAAYQRLLAKHEKDRREGKPTSPEIASSIIVEESDMERIALDRTLGRLWRAWKKRIRSPAASMSMSMSRSFSIESMYSQTQASRATSVAQEDSIIEDEHGPSIATVLEEYEHAATIPLPLSEDDVREIEIPGVAPEIDNGVEVKAAEDHLPSRPKSMVIFSTGRMFPLTPETGVFRLISAPETRKRSSSQPTPKPLPYVPSSELPDVTDETEIEENSKDISTSTIRDSEQYENLHDAEPSEENELNQPTSKTGNASSLSIVTNNNQESEPQSSFYDHDSEDELEEEVQIMTSSRISISEAALPEDMQSPSRRSSVRSRSVTSIRLIDVASPRSPSRSFSGDADYMATGRGINRSNTGSIHDDRNNAAIKSRPSSTPSPRNSTLRRTRTSESITEEDAEAGRGSPQLSGTPSESAPSSRPSDEFPKEETTPKSSPFVLGAAPAPRNRDVHIMIKKDHTIIPPVTNGMYGPRPSAVDAAPAPLAPLREIAESSPERPRKSPLRDQQVNTENPPYGRPPNRMITEQQKPPRTSSAGVNRNSPPRASREDSRPKVQRPSPLAEPSPTSYTPQKPKSIRSSEENSTPIVEDKSHSFEQLIRSDQTIQYTLTSQGMREIENPDSPRATTEMPRPGTSRSHSGSVMRVAVVQNPPPETPKVAKAFPGGEKRSTDSPMRPGSRPGSRRPSVQARDARVDQSSVEDFADFIRSTGPPGSRREKQVPFGAPNGAPRNGSATNLHGTPVASTPKRSDSSARRIRLQARDPVPKGDSSSELIDFIREGPPRGINDENPRIPRQVAPFRTTMDSDQMSGPVNGRTGELYAVDRGSYSTSVSAEKSVNSSINSTSGLISHAAPPKKTPVAPTSNPMDFGEEDMMPKRKTRRVRDPYAIDFSDEEDEEDEDEIEDLKPKRRPQPIKEESLADFLMNVPPPADNAPTPLVLDTGPNVLRKDVKKKASSQSLMSRFGRNGSISSQNSPRRQFFNFDSRPSTMASTQGSIAGSIASAPPMPILAKVSTSTAPPRKSSYASQVDSSRNPGPRVAQRSYAPRDPSYRPTKTDDLADFLRNSEPPPGAAQPKALDPSTLQKRGGFSKMFGREKKVSGY
ncbi:hypothetical protein F5884DRAFT_286677 [Xylogone sp. PMI_703]|nr:hypothetical protein F5884DRAFT_286677 [Xylogone sp. PMI_703]